MDFIIDICGKSLVWRQQVHPFFFAKLRMERNISVQGRALTIFPLLGNWLNSENKLFTKVMEEQVTNLQSLLAFNAMTALAACMIVASNMLLLVLAIAWFVTALIFCQKGGMK